jgi:hypothetical protein
MLNLVPNQTGYGFPHDFVPLIVTNSLPQLSSLLYESLSMESVPPLRATRYTQEKETPAESLVHVNLMIPLSEWSGCSALTISLPSPELSSDTQEGG